MRERDIERYLTQCVKDIGGKAYKFTSPGNNGVPDRIVILPRGQISFIELKAPNQKPKPLQMAQMKKLKDLGCDVRIIDSKKGVDEYIIYATRLPKNGDTSDN